MIRNFLELKSKVSRGMRDSRLTFLRVRIFAAAIAGVLGAAVAFGQNQAHVARRPRIGLVLEGGGALGLAHIGVIEWFEEHHIPVRYVAATSMGALVGGIYA